MTTQPIEEFFDSVREVYAENERLRRVLSPAEGFPNAWGLTPVNRRVLATLVKFEVASHEMIKGAARGKSGVAPVIFSLREKLTPLGYNVINRQGTGYYMPEAERLDLSRYVNEEKAPSGEVV